MTPAFAPCTCDVEISHLLFLYRHTVFLHMHGRQEQSHRACQIVGTRNFFCHPSLLSSRWILRGRARLFARNRQRLFYEEYWVRTLIPSNLFSACARVQGDWSGRVLDRSPPTEVDVSFTSSITLEYLRMRNVY